MEKTELIAKGRESLTVLQLLMLIASAGVSPDAKIKVFDNGWFEAIGIEASKNEIRLW